MGVSGLSSMLSSPAVPRAGTGVVGSANDSFCFFLVCVTSSLFDDLYPDVAFPLGLGLVLVLDALLRVGEANVVSSSPDDASDSARLITALAAARRGTMRSLREGLAIHERQVDKMQRRETGASNQSQLSTITNEMGA
jgi:hypothetical protein